MTLRPTFRNGDAVHEPPAAAGPDQGVAGATAASRPLSDRPAGAEPATDRDERSAAAARRRLSIEQPRTGFRRVPNSGQIARRRLMLRWTKWILPVAALLLLVSIATWPEIDRSMNSARIGLKQMAQVQVDSGRMIGPRYHGLDSHNRPYMITADEAQQVTAPQPRAAAAGPATGAAGTATAPAAGTVGGAGRPAAATKAAVPDDRINLARPIADMLSQGGSWVRISARNGVYMQHSQLLDLDRDVTLYRDDGIMMTSPVADLDLKRGVIASDRWVHAEGPFGVLDAQAYLLSQRDGIGQFRGPGRLILNDDRIARPTAAASTAAAPPVARPAGIAP
ncbi:LPS export ABC transporter periplasmic protein LptC [Lichenicola sp.]|uniref:LPS export ABC transporter periplasmic protein LptC n=1 Tax=Lichenicola sp. TaxID=2804529 RepID=UPI003B00DD81